MLRRRFANGENQHSSSVLEFGRAQEYFSNLNVCDCHFHSGFVVAGEEKGFEL